MGGLVIGEEQIRRGEQHVLVIGEEQVRRGEQQWEG